MEDLLSFIYGMNIPTWAQLALHFFAGSAVVAFFKWQSTRSLGIVAAVFATGFGKELLDQARYGGADWLDLVFTCLPALILLAWEASKR